MPKIFWLSLNKRRLAAIIGAALGVAQIAQAETPLCFSLPPVAGQAAAVRDSWPYVLQNAFDENGAGHAHLSLRMLIAVSRGDAAPCLASYTVESLQMSASGKITGTIIPTSMDYPVFFFEKATIDPAMIVDWRYVPKGSELAFGVYRMREVLTDPTEAELSGLGLQRSAIPSDWK